MRDPASSHDPQPADHGRPDPAASLGWLYADAAPPAGLAAWARAHVRALAIGGALLALGVAGIAWQRAGRSPEDGMPGGAVPPAIAAPFAPERLRALSPAQAARWNAGVPVSADPNPAAAEFAMGSAAASDYQRALQCLTMAVYYEAGYESADGERAVAQVVLNRVRHPAYPASVCGVVFEGSQRRTGCQFTFTCDGALARVPEPAAWQRAAGIAASALSGLVFAPVGLATHYHASYVVPYWAARLDKVTTIGAHVFYRWDGGWGQKAAFSERYAGAEPALSYLVAPMAGLAGEDPGIAAAETPAATPAPASTPTARPVLLGGGAAVAAVAGLGTNGADPNGAGRTAPAQVVGLGERRIILRAGTGPLARAPLGEPKPAASPAGAATSPAGD